MILGILLGISIVLATTFILLVVFVKPKKALLHFQAREDKDHMFYFIAKITAFIVFGLFLYRIWHPEVFETIRNRNGLFSPNMIVVMVLVRTSLVGAIFLLVITPWFNYRPYMNGVAVFGTVAYILNIYFYRQNIQAMLGIVEVPTYSIREILFAIELVLGLALCLLYLFKRIKDRDIHKIWLQALITPVLYVFFSILLANPYSFENLFDLSEFCGIANNFSQTHILVIAGMFVIAIVCSAIFRNIKDKKILHCFLASLSLICLIDYLYGRDYGDWANWKLPLHICNTGVFLMFVSFTVKNKPIFYFNYLINIVGALFAIFMPDCDLYILQQGGLHFWYNHVLLFILPIVAVAGGFYERPKLKYVIFSVIVFVIYFLLVAFLDALWQDEVNFFFLNGDSIVDRFVWAPHLKNDYIVTFNLLGQSFKIYWLYWTIVFFVYVAFIFVAWFVFATLYQVSDGYADLITRTRAKTKEHSSLKKEMGDRNTKEPLHPENKGKVIISHFSKIYPGTTHKAVDDFSIEIQPGTVYGFLGHNGAGKSTTIKSLVGIQTITEGNMEINGYDLSLQPLEAKMNIGYVSDNHTVYDHLTGREYINYVADLYLVNDHDREERIEKYTKMFAMEDAIDREIKGYSHGMKQKIVIIGSLVHQPKIWVLDEPLTGLDPTSSIQIKNIMKEYAEQGNIVFFSSHVIEVVEKICDEICIINQGKLMGTWKIKDLVQQGLTLQDLYVKYVSYKGESKNV